MKTDKRQLKDPIATYLLDVHRKIKHHIIGIILIRQSMHLLNFSYGES